MIKKNILYRFLILFLVLGCFSPTFASYYNRLFQFRQPLSFQEIRFVTQRFLNQDPVLQERLCHMNDDQLRRLAKLLARRIEREQFLECTSTSLPRCDLHRHYLLRALQTKRLAMRQKALQNLQAKASDNITPDPFLLHAEANQLYEVADDEDEAQKVILHATKDGLRARLQQRLTAYLRYVNFLLRNFGLLSIENIALIKDGVYWLPTQDLYMVQRQVTDQFRQCGQSIKAFGDQAIAEANLIEEEEGSMGIQEVGAE